MRALRFRRRHEPLCFFLAEPRADLGLALVVTVGDSAEQRVGNAGDGEPKGAPARWRWRGGGDSHLPYRGRKASAAPGTAPLLYRVMCEGLL